MTNYLSHSERSLKSIKIYPNQFWYHISALTCHLPKEKPIISFWNIKFYAATVKLNIKNLFKKICQFLFLFLDNEESDFISNFWTCIIYFKDQLKSEEVSILQYQVDPAPSVVLVVHGPVAPGQELHRLVFVDLELVVVRPRLELGRVLFHEPFALRIVRRRRGNIALAAVQYFTLKKKKLFFKKNWKMWCRVKILVEMFV